ncbi:Uncharacterized membrane protein YcaP, DUF421 family [Lentibacillus halodurans]|uniref:Uncharacterized membrane protein YcaP, DUF421 family n=1 Tax=Lentibacillus halodurans TaxID=237679 RepID=A0A1I0W2X0_9BACI|nr:DUF421 domain-containing protein [Lentibacillus halodurans]SFA82961.1 Uncharacterized membrane protein YcaP, DUF421 family [Lentibacillus halodurans]
MFWFIGKTILLYFITIMIIRTMGKSAFAQLTAHDLAAIFFVISLATGPVVTENLVQTITGLVVIGLVHIGFSRLMLFNRLNKIFVGKPTVVIKHGSLIQENLKGSHFTLSELLSEVREKGYPDISIIDYGIIEPNGGISIVPKQEIAPVTPEQLDVETSYQGLPIAVIIEGRTQHQNLELINKDEQWLDKKLAAAGYPDRNQIFYAAVRDGDDSLLIDTGAGSNRNGQNK